MIPTFELGPLTFPAYFTLLTIGFMFAFWLGWKEAPRVGVDQNQMLDLSLLVLVLGLVGARVLHVIADGYFDDYVNLCLDPFLVKGKALPRGWHCPSDFVCQVWQRGELCNPDTGLCHPGRDCLRTLKIWYGGLAYYGGFLAAFAGAMWFIARKKMPVWKVCDIGGFTIALGLVFGRIGCFFAGCCFGAPCETFPGMSFPKGSPAWQRHVDEHLITRIADMSLPVHPTQLYLVVTNTILFVVTYWMFRKRRTYDGKVLWWFMLLYGVFRTGVEFWRDDDRGVWLGGISTSQLISIPLIVIALVMMWRGHRGLKAREADARAS